MLEPHATPALRCTYRTPLLADAIGMLPLVWWRTTVQ